MSADELADGEEYEWLDWKPGRLVGDRHEEAAAAAAAAAADGEDDGDAPSDGALFAELELTRISGAELGIGEPEDSGGSDSMVPVISFGDQARVAYMPGTGKVVAFSERSSYKFFEQVSVQMGDETHMF